MPLRTTTTDMVTPSTGNGVGISSAPAANAGPLLPIGAIASRRGRVTRGNDGSLIFAFDSGPADLKATSAAAPVLDPATLANTRHHRALSERAGEGATYTISGDVTTYRDRNYLLVRSYKVNRVADQIMPTQ